MIVFVCACVCVRVCVCVFIYVYVCVRLHEDDVADGYTTPLLGWNRSFSLQMRYKQD